MKNNSYPNNENNNSKMMCKIVIVITIVLSAISGGKSDVNSRPLDELSVTITAKNDALKDLSNEITLQTNYEIILDNKITDLNVSGKFIDVPVEKFFTRALRGENITITFNEQEKKITVKIFGNTNTGNFYSTKGYINKTLNNGEIQRDQVQLFKEYNSDPLALDVLSGTKNADKWELHSRQSDQFNELDNDPDFIDVLNNSPNRVIWEKQNKQDLEFKKLNTDPSYVSVLSSRTNEELEEMQKKQDLEFKKLNTDPNYVSVLSGRSNKDIEEMHKRQAEEYRNSIKNLQ